jgi:hypothetical protein
MSVSVAAFQETSALYQVLIGENAEARRIVGEMSPAERVEFAGQLDLLRGMLTDRFGNSYMVPKEPKGLGEVTYADVQAYPYYYIRGEGRGAAEASRCDHDNPLTDSCPNCP